MLGYEEGECSEALASSRLGSVTTDRPGKLNSGMSMSLQVQRSWAEDGSLLTSLIMACEEHCTWVKCQSILEGNPGSWVGQPGVLEVFRSLEGLASPSGPRCAVQFRALPCSTHGQNPAHVSQRLVLAWSL